MSSHELGQSGNWNPPLTTERTATAATTPVSTGVQNPVIEQMRRAEDTYKRRKTLLTPARIDNMKAVSAFFRPREDQRPIYDGTRRTNVGSLLLPTHFPHTFQLNFVDLDQERLEVLRLKYVLLLISDLELPPEELHVLHLIHNEHTMRKEYDILWLPIVDPLITMTPEQDSTFYNLRNNMPWFSADHPSVVDPVAIRYIREDLRLMHAPMLAVLSAYGKLVNNDALPMMWIWGAAAFPFDKAWERALWGNSDWNIDLIVDHIDPRIPAWIDANKVICLYGGDDINWIRKFTLSARRAASTLNVPLEMLYVGKSNPREDVHLCHQVITREKLSHIFSTDYYDYVWYFWVRIASMWKSTSRSGRTVEKDRIAKGILDLLTFDSGGQGWAVFGIGDRDLTMASGDKLLPVVDRYTEWAYEVDHPDKFVRVLDKHLHAYHPKHHCHRLILPDQAGYIPERVACLECSRNMEKYAMYRCCTD